MQEEDHGAAAARGDTVESGDRHTHRFINVDPPASPCSVSSYTPVRYPGSGCDWQLNSVVNLVSEVCTILLGSVG
jgi:hypothetical protein